MTYNSSEEPIPDVRKTRKLKFRALAESEYQFEIIIPERFISLDLDENYSSDLDELFDARIIARRFDRPDSKPIKAGTVSFYILRVDRAINHGVNMWIYCDELSGDLLACWEALFEPDGYDLKSSVEELIDTVYDANVLYFDRIQVEPRFRGNKLGLAVLKTLMETYRSGCGIAALICTPLEMRDKNTEPDGDSETPVRRWRRKRTPKEKQAHAKLGKYYSQLGFKKIPRTDVYAFNLSYELP